jgi:endothelin-converting enzyme
MASSAGTTDPPAGNPDERTPLLTERDPEPAQDETGPAEVTEATEPTPAAAARQQYWISFAFGIFLVIIFVLIVVFLALHRSPMAAPASALCLTPACIHAADKILTGLAPNYKDLDPCTDFDQSMPRAPPASTAHNRTDVGHLYSGMRRMEDRS